MFSKQTIVVASQQQMSSDLDGEAIILDLSRGMYYGLDGVGAQIWRLIQQPRAVADLQAAIVAEYDVTSERCEQDLHALLGDLSSAGLIEVTNETVG